jgi:transposase InsO family protein
LLQTHWVLVVMDQFSRRIVGFGVNAGDVDGVALCRVFNFAMHRRYQDAYCSSPANGTS